MSSNGEIGLAKCGLEFQLRIPAITCISTFILCQPVIFALLRFNIFGSAIIVKLTTSMKINGKLANFASDFKGGKKLMNSKQLAFDDLQILYHA